jgi:hypothetical protein
MKIKGITKSELGNVLNQFNRFANTYFWTPPQQASSRRSEERRNSNFWEFEVDGQNVSCEIKISCSCKNYYSNRIISVAGENKKMMIPYLKKLIEKGEFIQ